MGTNLKRVCLACFQFQATVERPQRVERVIDGLAFFTVHHSSFVHLPMTHVPRTRATSLPGISLGLGRDPIRRVGRNERISVGRRPPRWRAQAQACFWYTIIICEWVTAGLRYVLANPTPRLHCRSRYFIAIRIFKNTEQQTMHQERGRSPLFCCNCCLLAG